MCRIKMFMTKYHDIFLSCYETHIIPYYQHPIILLWGVDITLLPVFSFILHRNIVFTHYTVSYTYNNSQQSLHIMVYEPLEQKINTLILYSRLNKLRPWMGTIYPRSDHYPPHPETPFSAKYLATRGPKMRLGTRKWIGVKRLTP